MTYSYLRDVEDMSSIINNIKALFGNLAQLTLPDSCESTTSGELVLTVYQNLKPVMRIEGTEMLLNLFREVFEDEKEEFLNGV